MRHQEGNDNPAREVSMDELGRLEFVLFQGQVHMQADPANQQRTVVDLLESVSSLEPRQQAQCGAHLAMSESCEG